VNMKYGEDVLKSVVKEPIGTGMAVNAEYNSGRPYFVSFRPLMHSTKRLSTAELERYEKYFNQLDDMDYQIAELKKLGVDALDLELEMKLTKGKVKEGSFQVADMYLETLVPRLAEEWKKIGKAPRHIAKEKIARTDVERGIETAKKEREKYIKKIPQETLTLKQEIFNLKKEAEEKKKKGKNTTNSEQKIKDLEDRIGNYSDKISDKDKEGVMREIEGIRLEIKKL
jgi:hypothetical protein